MLTFLKVKNIALIDEIEIEFGPRLNLLTGETGSGKSIVIDSLGALTGNKISSELIKNGQQSAQIEGLFSLRANLELRAICDQSGIELDDESDISLIVRRHLSLNGKNRIFVNNQLVTNTLLRELGRFLADIHGQGEHAALLDAAAHLEMFDEYTNLNERRQIVAEDYRNWATIRAELATFEKDQADKFQLLDILRFQVDEIKKANLQIGEEESLEEEKRRLNSVEKLSTLSEDAYALLYENTESTMTTLGKTGRKIDELAEYDSRFREYKDGVISAQAILDDLAITIRDFRNRLEFSPERLDEIENRLAEISRFTRKYGGSIESVLEHLKESEERLENIETAEFHEEELRKKLRLARTEYLEAASRLHDLRLSAAPKFEKVVENDLKAVALEKARFEVRIDAPEEAERQNGISDKFFTARGFDRVEFFFSANPGESPKPLVKVVSGGEASRLMLILKTIVKTEKDEKTSVFDEIDAGVGGRVAESVGLKLKKLAQNHQVICVTHQPQIASKADRHFLIEKDIATNRTTIAVRELNKEQQIEEVARMLAGEKITEASRANAREMLKTAYGS